MKISEQDDFDFLALIEGDAFIGFMVIQTCQNLVYLFFLAIDKKYRQKGYGSKAITAMEERYPDRQYVVDFEMIEDNAPNRMQRIKRREFYLKNGYQETGLFLTYGGVNYEVFCMHGPLEVNAFKELMKRILVEGFHPKYFTKQNINS